MGSLRVLWHQAIRPRLAEHAIQPRRLLGRRGVTGRRQSVIAAALVIVMQEVAARTDGRLKLSPGTLYGAIRRLLELGLIQELDERPDPERGKRWY